MSRIVTFEDRGSFRKCVDESELDDKEQLICSSVNNGTAQFEVQLPKIQRHKYLPDERKYGLIPEYDSTNQNAFQMSSCLQTTEDDHYVTFRGPLDGNQNCQIYQTVEFDGISLYDVYEFVIGYDDLVDTIGDRSVIIKYFN